MSRCWTTVEEDLKSGFNASPQQPNTCLCCQILSLGMLLRYFVNFYDMEIIEEEAFLAWKEDITQEFPGKGKALFQVLWGVLQGEYGCPILGRRAVNMNVCRPQVNQWLTWLETAEEEESDDEAD